MVRSNKEEFAPLWDVCVHFLEIKAGYDWGLMNRMKEDLADVMSCKRNMFYLAVGFRF